MASNLTFGVFVPQGWKTELIGIDGAEAKWDKAVETAVLAEELGYDSIWVYDHFHNVPTPAHEAVFECWTTLAALSQRTSRVRLGQMVGCSPYRNPGLLAKITSNIDVMSGGRLDWGIGAGWYEHEFKGYGYDFHEPKVRIQVLRETVEIVKSMWSEPDTTYEGRHFTLQGAQCDPKPLQQPHPPVWIGGGGEQLTLRVVARHADRSNFGGKPHEFQHKCEVLQQHCKDVGRDYDEIQKTWSPEVFIRETEAEIEEGGSRSFWGEPFDSWSAGNLVGTPEQVAEKIRAYVDLGCTGFVPWCSDYPDHTTLRLLAEKVPARGPLVLPVVTPAEMGEIDAAAPEPVEVLIGRAGAAVARTAVRMLGGTYGRRVVVVAGKGNNGNDGRDAARRLEARGAAVAVIDVKEAPDRLPPADLVVDAAFGTGFRGEYRAPDPAGAPVLAVDIPSGVNGLTGVAAERVLTAERTITFAALKPGLLLHPGAQHCGEVEVADIGLDVSGATAHLVEPADAAGWIPSRAPDAHKWRSAVWVAAGSPGMTGAAHLAARAAQRAGAGYVRLGVPGGAAGEGAPVEATGVALPAEGWADAVLDDLERFRALVVGPGLGRDGAAAAAVRSLVAKAPVPVVVDGDGLSALADGDAAGHLRVRPAATVLTPHDGEFSRLAGSAPGDDRLGAARDLAERLGAVVLLKGPTTLVAAPDRRVLVVTSGDERLATAGTGDVLSGAIAALLAQGVPAWEAAAAGAHLHGAAGALGWRRGLVAGDVAELLPAALAQLPEV